MIVEVVDAEPVSVSNAEELPYAVVSVKLRGDQVQMVKLFKYLKDNTVRLIDFIG